MVKELKDNLKYYGITCKFFGSYIGIHPSHFKNKGYYDLLYSWSKKLDTFDGALEVYSAYHKYLNDSKSTWLLRTNNFGDSEITAIRNK